jgi:Flp pilus assembly protein CpaB
MEPSPQRVRSHGPKAVTVFAAAFVAGAAVAFCLNRALDIHLAQAKPQVESEPIFVALRGLPQGAQITVWDVGLRDWPKAMVPGTAMRANDSLEGLVVRHPLREGQPVLSVQLGRAATGDGGQLASVIPLERPPVAESTLLPAYDIWSDGKAPATIASPAPEAPRQRSGDAHPAAESIAVVPAAVPSSPPAVESTSAAAVTPPAASPESTLAEVAAAPESPTVAEPAFATPVEADEPQVVSVLPAGAPVAAEEALPEASLSVSKVPSPLPESASQAATAPESAKKPAAQPSSKRPSFNRYLVVPERIAMQADAMTERPALAPAEVSQPDPARLQPQRTEAAAAKTTAGQQRQRPGSKGTSPQKSSRVAR